MICGRVLSSTVRRTLGSSWKTLGTQQSWMIPNTRTITSIKLPTSFQQRSYTKPDLNIVARRFLHQYKKDGGAVPEGGFFAHIWSKIIATVGAIVAVGSGAAFHAMVDENSIFKGYPIAHCAGKCEDKCIEKKCEDAPCLRKSDCEEEIIVKANAELEKVLKEVKLKAIEHTEIAMKAYCEAIEIMQEFINQAYCIIDADEIESPMYEESWCCLFELSKKRCAKVRDALTKGMCAWELLCRLRETITSGRQCKYTSCNPLLKTAEQVLMCAEKEMLALKQKMDCVGSDHEMVDQYRQVIDSFRQDLKSDLESYPDEEKCDIKFCEQETALIVNEAYKKTIRCQKEMAMALICSGKVPEKFATTEC